VVDELLFGGQIRMLLRHESFNSIGAAESTHSRPACLGAM
jgi:hypothetical protein